MVKEESYFKYTPVVLILPMIAVLLIWTVYWVEVRFQVNFNSYGIYPRTIKGLRGVLFSPFIHGSISHLYNNSIPLMVLLASLCYFYRNVAAKVLFWGFLGSGILTWVIARPSFHIGASGIIYLLASFIFFKGVRTKHYRLIALSLAVVFIYGGLLWYIFPVKEGISWEGHLSGFAMGLLLAIIMPTQVPQKKKFDWEREDYNEEDDPFLRQFDKEGNFIEPRQEDDSGFRITYNYKKNSPEDSKED